MARVRLYDRQAKMNMLSARTFLAKQKHFQMLAWEEYWGLDNVTSVEFACHIFCTQRSA